MNMSNKNAKDERYQIKYLRDIDKGNQTSKIISIGSLIFSFGIVVVAMLFYKNAVIGQKPQPYIMDKNGEIRKVYDTYDDGYETISKKGCIEKAHELFFEISPDEQLIKSKITKSFYYGDFKGMYEFYNSQNYYNNLVQRNAIQYVKTDSIIFRGDFCRYYGRMKIIGQGKVSSEKKLITEFVVKKIDRSDNNLYGFYIENFKMIDNAEISVSNNAIGDTSSDLMHPNH